MNKYDFTDAVQAEFARLLTVGPEPQYVRASKLLGTPNPLLTGPMTPGLRSRLGALATEVTTAEAHTPDGEVVRRLAGPRGADDLIVGILVSDEMANDGEACIVARHLFRDFCRTLDAEASRVLGESDGPLVFGHTTHVAMRADDSPDTCVIWVSYLRLERA